MAEMRIGVANGGAVMNGVSGVGTGATGQAAAPPPTPGPAGVLASGVEAGVAPQAAPQVPAAAPATPAPAQAAWQASPPAAPPISPAPAQPMAAQPQVAPYSPPSAAAPPIPQTPFGASNAVFTSGESSSDSSTTLSSSSAAAIAVPLTIVACAILLLAGLIWWYKRHPPRHALLGRRRSHRERDEMSISEKALILIPGYDTPQSRTGSVRSMASTPVGSVRGVTVVPHVDVPVITRPAPSVAPSIASVRRPTAMNIQKPLPPISDYGGSSSSSGSSSRTHSTVPVIHSATLGRRADAQFVRSQPPPSRSMHPTIMEDNEQTDSEDGMTTAPSSPRSRMRSTQQQNYFTTSRMTTSNPGGPTSRRPGPPAASVYSTHSVPLPRSKRLTPSRRPIPVEAYSYTQSLPASIARNAPVSTVRRSPAPPSLGHSPQSSCESESLPETVDFPSDHPFARKYAGSSASSSHSRSRDSRSQGGEDTESMMRSITARTELTLPWGFAEAGKGKGRKDGVEPLRKPAKGTGAKLFREETRKGADWARERSY